MNLYFEPTFDQPDVVTFDEPVHLMNRLLMSRCLKNPASVEDTLDDGCKCV